MTATTTRIDVHRPSSALFDPSAYEYYGAYDLDARAGTDEDAALVLAVRNMHAQGFINTRDFSHCGHCGQRIRYGALMIQREFGEFIFVGATCLDHRFTLASAEEFQRLRLAARLDRERVAQREAFAVFMTAHSDLSLLTYPEFLSGWAGDFVRSIASQVQRGQVLSARQVQTVREAIHRDIARAAERVMREEAIRRSEPVPTGNVIVEGEVVSVRTTDGYMGGTVRKMTVLGEGGWRVYVTVPTSISEVTRGQKVLLHATVSASPNDASFGFGKRPGRAIIL